MVLIQCKMKNMLCDTGILVAPNQNKVWCIVGCCIYHMVARRC